MPPSLCAARRLRLLEPPCPPGSLFVLPAAPVAVRNGDVEHPYRQDSDLWYLTGLEEPHSVLVLSTSTRKVTLFVRPRTAESTQWEWDRLGLEDARALLGADEAFPIAEFDQELPRLLAHHTRLYFRLGLDRALDNRVLLALDTVRKQARKGVSFPQEIVEPGVLLHEMRLIKDAHELDCMRKASQMTCEAHLRAMAKARPGLHEYQLEAELLAAFRAQGAERVAYPSIVGSGERATVLHGRASSRVMQAGELVLIDAGCEHEGYASDVTRTFPVNGRFSREQEALYELVLEAQEASLEKVYPGSTLHDVHEASVEVLTRGLVQLGLLSGEVEALQTQGAYRRFFMHHTSHWLGLDVHDVGRYSLPDGTPRPLMPGMVLTVEPGLYIASNDTSVPAAYRGLGVRIEDDLVVTAEGAHNLTASLPKSVRDLERICAQS